MENEKPILNEEETRKAIEKTAKEFREFLKKMTIDNKIGVRPIYEEKYQEAIFTKSGKWALYPVTQTELDATRKAAGINIEVPNKKIIT